MSVGNAYAFFYDPAPLTRVSQLVTLEIINPRTKVEKIFSTTMQELQASCMALALYHEARSESEEGQKAVGQVILNRSKSDAYPETICGVVFENIHLKNRCQFSFACDGRSDIPTDNDTFAMLHEMAEEILDGEVYAEGLEPSDADDAQLKKSQVTHYHTTAVSPAWGKKLEPIATIGSHIFYRSERAAKSL